MQTSPILLRMDTKPYSIRLDANVAKNIQQLGVASDRKFSDMARHLLRFAIQHYEANQGSIGGAGHGRNVKDSTSAPSSES